MKIDSSQVTMHGSHMYSTEQFWTQESTMTPVTILQELPKQETKTSLGDQVRDLFQELREGRLGTLQNRGLNSRGIGIIHSTEELQMALILRLRKHLHGQKQQGLSMRPAGNTVEDTGMYLRETSTSSFYKEEELTTFTSKGKVTSANGQTYEFNISFELSRSYETYSRTNTSEIVKLCDPLVLQFDGDPATLGDQKFLFDLNCDGTMDQLSNLQGNGGFLALDKNQDGMINNGSELFGARTGDGFGELAAYDEDDNGWIDENDSVFGKLQIWTMDQEGNPKLMAVTKENIGAIFLGRANTAFGLKDSVQNTTYGQIQESGIYLTEDGKAGLIQHVDFAI